MKHTIIMFIILFIVSTNAKKIFVIRTISDLRQYEVCITNNGIRSYVVSDENSISSDTIEILNETLVDIANIINKELDSIIIACDSGQYKVPKSLNYFKVIDSSGKTRYIPLESYDKTKSELYTLELIDCIKQISFPQLRLKSNEKVYEFKDVKIK